ncbi:hypothetical protein AMELA_G00154990 [Ameiurus melas]|uniref:Uncharacterized protein n=1 Tax=Ameiurus melas TaxID=219545 RepID=A0A7J6AJ87_AMEME|nr:hypothetical protein AMELA_G00154990 [Ameiurus melas]
MYSKYIRFNHAHSYRVTGRIIYPISAQFLSVTSTRHAFCLKKATNSSRGEQTVSARRSERTELNRNHRADFFISLENTTSFFSTDVLFIPD